MIPPTVPDHPRLYLEQRWIDLLRKEAPQAEKQGGLTPKQLQLFYKQGWFKALVPQKYGGLEWSLSQVVSFEEAIGWAEGSAGWVFTLCSGAGWFGGYLDPRLAKSVFSSKKACLAGSGAIGGVAKSLEKGMWQISGQWQYATGAPHGTCFTANVYVTAEKRVRAVILPVSAIKIEKNWQTIGLVASASESFSVAGYALSDSHFFDIDPDQPVVRAPLYRMPFGALAEATIAANLSGMALHFMEEVVDLWEMKAAVRSPFSDQLANRPVWMQTALKAYKTHMRSWQQSRNKLFQSVHRLENFVGIHMDTPNLLNNKGYQRASNAVSRASQELALCCRAAVNGLYPYTGLTGAHRHSAIGKVWRDFQTGSQHALFIPKQGE